MPLEMFVPTETPKIGYAIAVAAGKGGVGKSTVAVNLALALQQRGYRVGIMDTDLYGPSIRKMLQEDSLPSQEGALIKPALCKGIKMISLAYFRKTHEAAAVRAPIANSIINQFLTQVSWGDLDYLLIDFPPGTGDIQLTLAQKGNLAGAILVTTPQEVALLDVRKAMHLFYQVKIPIVGIVENMSYYEHSPQEKIYLFGKDGGKGLAEENGLPFLGAIPIDPTICQHGDAGTSLFHTKEGPKAKNALLFLKMAEKMEEELRVLKKQREGSLDQFEMVWKECEQ